MEGLWASGEVTGGVHGKNRLMGNSLLDILVFGRRAAESVKEEIPDRGPLTLTNLKQFRKNLPESLIKSPLFFPAASKINLNIGKPEIETAKSSSSSLDNSAAFDPPDPFAR